MSLPDKHGFPLIALPIGGFGTIAAVLGILASTAPEVAIGIWPLLAQGPVASALIVMGVMLMLVEAVMILRWVRRRQASSSSASPEPVHRTRDIGQ